VRLVRYLAEGAIRHGVLDQATIREFDGDLFGARQESGVRRSLDEVTLLAPVAPTKIVAAGLNFAAHASEHHVERPQVPLLFFKPPSALILSGEPILLPDASHHVNEEAELVVVIGARAQRLDVSDAAAHILGYTCGNDVSDRDVQEMDRNWTARAKGYDTFAPILPWVETELDPSDAAIEARINDVVVQRGSTRDFIFDVPSLVAFASHCYTLEPGDLIFTGTPSGVSPLQPGDTVSITIDGIGTLTNPVERLAIAAAVS
jgi:2-keto-4-pentenoate hydratase/2-oxohepta-3-ene-1,7-dioic acid hydratase in catechol pathway